MSKPTFAPLPARVCLDNDLSPLDFRVLSIIALHDRMSARKEGQGCWSKHDTMAEEIGCTTTSFSRSVKKLLDSFYVERVRAKRDRRMWVYRVIYADSADCEVIKRRRKVVSQGGQLFPR